MSQARYQVKALVSEQAAVKTHRGLDPVTGLPVLIYQFAGKPRATSKSLQSDHIPSILSAKYNGKQGMVVVASPQHYRALNAAVSKEDIIPLLLGTANALRTAAQARVIHGDLRPERFLHDGKQHYVLEGYGARWDAKNSAYQAPEETVSLAADVFSWAKAVRALAGNVLPEAFMVLLSACLAKDSKQRPSAEDIFDQIDAYAQSLADAETASDDSADASDGDPFADFELDTGDSSSARKTAKTASFSDDNSDSGDDSDGDIDFDFDLASSEEASVSTPQPARNKAAKTDSSTDFDFSFEEATATASSAQPAAHRSKSQPAEDAFDAFALDDLDDLDALEANSDDKPDKRRTAAKSNADVFMDNGAEDDIGLLADDDDDAFLALDDDSDLNGNEQYDDEDGLFLVNTDPGKSSSPSVPAPPPPAPPPAASSPAANAPKAFVKDLPPGATYRSGNETSEPAPLPAVTVAQPAAAPETHIRRKRPPKRKRNPNVGKVLLVLAMLIGSGAVAYWVYVTRNDRTPISAPPPPRFLVTVSIEPDSLRNVSLSVISRPSASSRRIGEQIAIAPGTAVLDAPGQWELQARFQDRSSGIVRFSVPETRNIVMVLPEASGSE